jgi:hypothetical protein
MCDYTIEFEAMAEDDRDIVRCNIAKNSDGTYSDAVITDYRKSFARFNVNGNSTAEFNKRPKGEFYSIRIEVSNKQLNLYVDGIYLTTETINGISPTLSFGISDWNSYYIRNLKITFQ